jgi:hypothetical protein
MGSAITSIHLSFIFATTHFQVNKIIVFFLPCEENRLRQFQDRVVNRPFRGMRGENKRSLEITS